ncbi:type IV secretion system protein VirD4 [Luteibacter rhizovicinus]|uniref:Type IV secretion system protein VirD4 n=1 Tax=Luteibacter rhizovicinus TaxID=242606 RepID=A0A4R3YPE9_9GAMM|nr:type IV secretory system conjugative DNA transfer family protein [Luteibacter rhizovicinus]TCV94765.1 type IV secretion system protein VirD4 [Luteibacter rhizovicinus]
MNPLANAPRWVKWPLGFVIVLATCATWFVAAGHALSWILFHGGGDPVSWHTWIDYALSYPGHPLVQPALELAGAIASLVILVPVIVALVRCKPPLHGAARFARIAEVRRAGLLTHRGDGIILGGYGRRFLTAGLADFPHVMLAAPTGSGKGVGVVIPNLLNWNHSVIVLDIKRENWTLTAGFRKRHGHETYLFDPASPDGRTHRWNPLAYVRDEPGTRIDDIQKIGSIIFPDTPGVDPLWSASCRTLFLGLALYVFETDDLPRTLGQIAREAYADTDDRLADIIMERYESGARLSAACEAALTDYANTATETRTSIRKTFTSRFELFLNPIVDAATSANDFDLEALRRKRISIYIGITPDNLARMAPLLNLFFQQVVDLNTRELPEHNPELKYQCLMLLDEFKSLGKLPLIVDAIAFLRGYGVRLLPIFQSPSQIREVYGEEAAKTFFQNHAIRISYTPADIVTATEISNEIGNTTVKSHSVSRPDLFSKGQRNRSDSMVSRALMLPQEVMALGVNEVLLFARGTRPIRGRKIRWYREKAFTSRILPPPTVPAHTPGGPEDR